MIIMIIMILIITITIMIMIITSIMTIMINITVIIILMIIMIMMIIIIIGRTGHPHAYETRTKKERGSPAGFRTAGCPDENGVFAEGPQFPHSLPYVATCLHI